MAGTGTTAATLEWAMAELIKNPSMMKKAQEEVRRVVGRKSKLDEADITHLQYLKCIIKGNFETTCTASAFSSS